jgi:tRNA(fMet)-specific endonuclease VapC
MPVFFSLDTSVCVALLRMSATQISDQLDNILDVDTVISSIVLGELETGIRKSHRQAWHAELLHRFLTRIAVIDFDSAAARHYGEIRAHLERRGTPIGPLDQLIAAHARSLGLTLITTNLREFKRVPGLKCQAWPATLPK